MLTYKDAGLIQQIYELLDKADDRDAVLGAIGVEGAEEEEPRPKTNTDLRYLPRPHVRGARSKYRQRRVALNMTQEQLARKSHTNKSAVGRFEHGGHVTKEQRDKIIAALDMPESEAKDLTQKMRWSKYKQARHEDRMKAFRNDPRYVELTRTLRDLRERSGASQGQLGRKAGFGETYVGEIERMNRLPSQDGLRRVAEALGVPLSIFGDVSWLNPEKPKGRSSAQPLVQQ